MINSSLVRSFELKKFNDAEIKRIMFVIERDFKLRQKEFKRIEEIKKIMQQEQERLEYISNTREFNNQRCIKCYRLFRFLLNPKELCSDCKLFICHDCSIFNTQTKTWTCKICLKLKELESLTGDWFYNEIGKKYKRCGSAKIIRELFKREKEFEIDERDEDFGYDTLRTNISNDSKQNQNFHSTSRISYIVRDKNLQNALDEYSKRLILLVDNLQSNFKRQNFKENVKDYQSQIATEISRARIALSDTLRHADVKSTKTDEDDLQNLLIQQTEESLRLNLQEFQKKFKLSNSNYFDEELSKMIVKSFNSRQNDDFSLTSSSRSSNSPSEIKFRTETVNEEEEELTPTNSEIIRKSTERVDDWKINFTFHQTQIVSTDNDGDENSTTWL